jgi:hypothetical protein
MDVSQPISLISWINSLISLPIIDVSRALKHVSEPLTNVNARLKDVIHACKLCLHSMMG